MNEATEMWATVELMGHGQTAGRISRPSDWGGLLRVDVPDGDGYRTEFYGLAAIYAVKFTSEEIARAYAQRVVEISAYNTPIVTRDQHEGAMERLRSELYKLESRNRELERRLTAVNALPGPTVDDSE